MASNASSINRDTASSFPLSNWRVRRQQSSMSMNTVILCALFVIGSLAAAGILPGTAIGGCSVGFSVPLFLSSLCGGIKPIDPETGKLEGRQVKIVFDGILACVLLVLGIFVLNGYVPPSVVGWGIISPIMLWMILNSCKFMCGVVEFKKSNVE